MTHDECFGGLAFVSVFVLVFVFAIINVIVDNDDQHLYLISLSHLLFKNIGNDGCFRNLVFVIVSD